MARNDIRCVRQTEDGLTAYGLNWALMGAQTFEEGEVVAVGAGGYVGEAATDPPLVTGISAASSLGMSANGEIGHLSVAGANTTPRPVGTWIQVYKPVQGQYFACSNLSEDGTGTTLITPLQEHVGDTIGFTLNGGVWGVDRTCANIHAEIVAVIDSHANFLSDINREITAGVSVVFGFLT